MDRKVVLDILNSIEKNKAFSNIAINEHIKRAEDADAAFIRHLVYGVLENKIYLDFFISRYITSPIEKVKKNSLNILRMSVYQILKMDSVPDYAAVNEAVQLAKETSKYQDGFINGVLRNIIREKEKGKFRVKLPDYDRDPVRRLSIEFSYPKWLIQYIANSYGMDFTRKFISASNEVPPMVIRANTLKITPAQLRDKLKEQGFEVEEGKNSANALRIKGSGLLNTESFKNGEFAVQDESSMMAIETLAPQPGDCLLDLCAAPGGKTLYAGELMKNSGRIIACDLYENKLAIVGRTAEKHGIENVECIPWDATEYNPGFHEIADRIICDVPCSGLGVIRRKPEIKYTKNIDDIKGLCRIQFAILKNAVDYLKPGGELLYSTCTISPAENQGAVNHLLKKSPMGKYEVLFSKLLTPFENDTDGFFICRLKKNF